MRNNRDRLLDMSEMCDLLIAHASDPDVLATDPVVQAAARPYFHIDQDIIGNVVQRDIQAIRSQLQQIIDNDQTG